MAIEYAAVMVTVNAAQLASWHGTASPDVLTLDGPCPVCGHDTAAQIPRRVSIPLERAASARPAAPLPHALTADLACACTVDHPGRPAGVTTGCGRTWFAVAAAAADGTVSLAPLPAPPDPALAAAAQALRAAGPQQLADIRSAAEKWIGGVTALFGLFGLAGVLTTRSTLTSLAAGWQAVIALTAAAAAALAGLAVYRIYRAAYGWPVTYPVNTNQELLAWYDTQGAAPRIQAGYLRDGVRAAGGALLALVVSAGFLLFAPAQTPTVPFVQVTLTDGSQVCGTLLPAAPGATLIRPSDGASVDLTARSIEAETVVTSC